MGRDLQELVLKNSAEIIRLWLERVDQKHKALNENAEILDEKFESTNRNFANTLHLAVLELACGE
ncbi:MAG: hypothetical protein H0Z32_12900 [Bacillaceae bacterium]|nr:hypothetical protein [Bacillaceae bacterium]